VGTAYEDEGFTLEQDYLDMLRGPQGESLEYNSQGLIKGVGTLLVGYDIKIGYSTETVTLYLDMFNVDPFVIPQGFSCAWSF
jgi:hypothetical protein